MLMEHKSSLGRLGIHCIDCKDPKGDNGETTSIYEPGYIFCICCLRTEETVYGG